MDRERIKELRAQLGKDGSILIADQVACFDALEAALARAEGAEARLVEWESFRDQISDLSYHHQGMGCGIEDRGITDRYEACEYGWDEALDRAYELMPEPRP